MEYIDLLSEEELWEQLEHNKDITRKMLLDWLLEVSDVFQARVDKIRNKLDLLYNSNDGQNNNISDWQGTRDNWWAKESAITNLWE